MPDHLHVFVQGQNEFCDLLRFSSAFKQRTGFDAQKQWKRRIWQSHFYDHILREQDSFERVAAYIWTNPVRKGLCADAADYPYSGSTTLPNWRKAFVRDGWVPPWREKNMAG